MKTESRKTRPSIFQVSLNIFVISCLVVLIVAITNFLFRISGVTETIANTSSIVALNFLKIAIGWIFAIFFLFLEVFFLYSIWIGTTKKDWGWDDKNRVWFKPKGINLERVISDENGDASMSRFQLLIFTLVVAMSLFYIIVASNPPAFPKRIPPEILGLLGISGTSYILAKAIQAGRDPEIIKAEAQLKQVENDSIASTTQQSSEITGVTPLNGSQSGISGPLVQIVTNGSQVGIRSNTSTATNESQVDTVDNKVSEDIRPESSGSDVK